MDNEKVPIFSLGAPQTPGEPSQCASGADVNDTQTFGSGERNVCGLPQGWGREPGAVTPPQLKQAGVPCPLPGRRVALKPRSTWKGGWCPFSWSKPESNHYCRGYKGTCRPAVKLNPWWAVHSCFRRSRNCWGKGRSVQPTKEVITKMCHCDSPSNQAMSGRPNRDYKVERGQRKHRTRVHFQTQGKGDSSHTHTHSICKLM